MDIYKWSRRFDLHFSLGYILAALAAHAWALMVVYAGLRAFGVTAEHARLLALLLDVPVCCLWSILPSPVSAVVDPIFMSWWDQDSISRSQTPDMPTRSVWRVVQDRLLRTMAGYRLIAATAAGLVNRSWRRKLLISLINWMNQCVSTPDLYAARYNVFYCRLLLLVDTVAPWTEVASVTMIEMRALPHPRTTTYGQAKVAGWFTSLYWINGRFDDARAAARHWCRLTEEDVAAYREDARDAFQFLNDREEYASAGQAKRQPGDELPKSPELPARFQKNLYRLSKFTAYREAHIVAGIQDWSSQFSEVTLRTTMMGLDLHTNPMWPQVLFSLKPLLRKCLPLDEATYHDILQTAEIL